MPDKQNRRRSVSKKILGWAVFAACVLMGLFGTGVYYQKIEAVRAEHIQEAQAAAAITAQILQGRDALILLQNHKEPGEDRMEMVLDDIRRSFSLMYLYAYVPAEDGRQITMVFTLADDLERVQDRSAGTVVPYELPDEEHEMMQGLRKNLTQEYKNEYGEVVSCLAPVYDAQGKICAIVGADTDIGVIQRQIIRETSIVILGMLILTSLILLCMYYGFQRVVLQHVRLLAERMRSFISGSAGGMSFEPVQLSSGDEFQEMAEAFNQMAKDTGQYVADIAAMTALAEKEKAEMEAARQIQLGMLPDSRRFLEGETAFSLHAFTCPARNVGGDFFDFFRVDADHLCIAIGDVSGKGVPSALFMITTRTLLKSYAMQQLLPSEILQRTNESLMETNPYDLFVTVFLGILDLQTGLLVFANGGHNPPFVKREFYRKKAVTAGMMLGAFEDASYTDELLALSAEEAVFLYTDGVTEAVNPQKLFFGEKRLLEALNEERTKDARALLEALQERLKIYAGNQSPWDDITMLQLTCRVRPATKEFKGEGCWPQLADYIRQQLQAAPPEVVAKHSKSIYLAVEEFYANTMEYGYTGGTGSIWVQCLSSKVGCILRMEDAGRAFNPLEAEEPDLDLEIEDRPEGGLGIFLSRQVMDTIEYRYENGHNILFLTKYW